MKKTYEKPVIRKLYSGSMNMYGSNPAYARQVRKAIDGVAIEPLVERYGSPLFVFSERTLRQRYRQMFTAFSTRYPNVEFGWSYKTNYLQAICAILHSEGAIAEVVSQMEYERARALGIPGEKIIFNGPHKPMAILQKAVSEGAAINIDNLDEVCDLESVASRLGQRLRVGMRINLDAGIYPQWSRFGFNLETGQAMDAAKRIFNGRKLAINGLHCHIGTFIMDASAYARQVEKMVAFAYEIERAFGLPIEYIDIGGGFPSRNWLKGTYLHPDTGLPSLDEFAEAVTNTLSRCLRPGDFPKLIVESGRAIVDEAGFIVSSVVAAKRLPDGTQAYVLDAGVNSLPTTHWYKLNIELDRDVPGVNQNCVLYGPLCMNIDVVDELAFLPALTRGTRLIFSPVGAYNVTQWMQFIQYRPNVVLIGENGEVDVIRAGEDMSDMMRREALPDRLTPTPVR